MSVITFVKKSENIHVKKPVFDAEYSLVPVHEISHLWTST